MTNREEISDVLTPVSKHTAEHYTWGGICDGWHLVKDAGLSVIQEQMPPGAKEVFHYHQKAQQFFYILSGEAVMEMNGQKTHLRAGQGLHVPRGTQHQIRNESSHPVEFLLISQPPSHGDRVVVEK